MNLLLTSNDIQYFGLRIIHFKLLLEKKGKDDISTFLVRDSAASAQNILLTRFRNAEFCPWKL
jgi:hypothetical protein